VTKIAVCCFYGAYPPVSGAAAVSFNLAKSVGGETLLIQTGSRASSTEVGGLRMVTVPEYSESKIGKVAGLKSRIRAIVAELRRFRPHAVILEGASWAGYHWMLMRAIRRALPEARLVYHSHNLEYLLRRQENGRAIAALTRLAEGRLLRGADLSTAVSGVDQAHFARLYGVAPAIVPNGVDTDRFAGAATAAVDRARAVHGLDDRTLLFSGFYAYPPNRVAVDFLVTSVMPALLNRYPSATLALTGGGAPYHESWIRNAGSVPYEDFAAFVAGCGVAATPIFSGSGTRLKILEAMAAGVPIVATEKAVEGLGLRAREHFMLAGNMQEFVDATATLFENPILAAHLRIRARQKVNAEFSWRAIASELEQAIAGLIEARDQAEAPSGLEIREAHR
jgi:glycosyltransferase involved in cell wall biosynthesis